MFFCNFSVAVSQTQTNTVLSIYLQPDIVYRLTGYSDGPDYFNISSTSGTIFIRSDLRLDLNKKSLHYVSDFYTPRKLCLWEGILFSRCPKVRPSDRPTVCPKCFVSLITSRIIDGISSNFANTFI